MAQEHNLYLFGIYTDYFSDNNSFTKEMNFTTNENVKLKRNGKERVRDRVKKRDDYNVYISNLHDSGSVAYSLLKTMKTKKK